MRVVSEASVLEGSGRVKKRALEGQASSGGKVSPIDDFWCVEIRGCEAANGKRTMDVFFFLQGNTQRVQRGARSPRRKELGVGGRQFRRGCACMLER